MTNDDLVLYAFTYPHFIKLSKYENKPIPVKFGDTTQGLEDGLTVDKSGEVRISQQGGSAEAYQKLIIGTWGVSKELISRDYQVHNKWKTQGLRPKDLDGKGTEWFYLGSTIDQVKDKINDTINSFGAASNKKLKLRKEQERTLTEAVEIY